MPRQYANNASSTLVGSFAIGATSFTLPTGHGSRFDGPLGAPSPTNPVRLTFEQGNKVEIVQVTGRTGDVLSPVARAVEICRPDTVATQYDFTDGATIELRDTAASYVDGSSAPFAGGLRYGSPGSYVPLMTTYSAAFSNFGMTLNSLRVHPLLVSENMVLDRLGIWLATIASDASAVMRLGVWAYDDTNHRPSTLLADSGALVVNGGVARFVEGTVSLSLVPGRYFVGAVLQGTANNATIAMTSGDSVAHIVPIRRTVAPSQTALRLLSALTYAGVSGALGNITTDPTANESSFALVHGRFV